MKGSLLQRTGASVARVLVYLSSMNVVLLETEFNPVMAKL
jgi:hypothetical protein